MAHRDPNKTARNRIIESIKQDLRTLLPSVLKATQVDSEASLNAKIGSKHDDFFDLKHDVIGSHDEFVMRWLEGLKNAASQKTLGAHAWIYQNLRRHPCFRKYVRLFLKRSYLRHCDELYKQRPHVHEAEIWIGHNNASYGLLVTPRFRGGQWENDKSEIRAFDKAYWTVGHVLKTGLVIPGKNRRFQFSDIEQYLIFFSDTLVRAAGSRYQDDVASLYCEFVRSSQKPEDVPLLIPEFRYAGLQTQHKYRLDFLIINPYTMDKIGFELSPWSTHGYLKNTKKLTAREINDQAQAHFEKEMRKQRAFFRRHGIFTLVYTDESLQDAQTLFKKELRPYLSPENPQHQLSFQIMEEFLSD